MEKTVEELIYEAEQSLKKASACLREALTDEVWNQENYGKEFKRTLMKVAFETDILVLALED
jgi:hypothetical protein